MKQILYKLTGNKRFLGLPFKFIFFDKQPFSKGAFTILDIGCGSHSASGTKKYFPQCKYYGLDLDRFCNNDEADFKLMEQFYEANLETSDLDMIPDDFFDCVMVSHVIEHIHNYAFVLKTLLKKLKKNGMMYIEYPAFRSTRLPSMYHTLNFFDDESHVYLHSNRDLANLFLKENAKILKMGTRRSLFEIVLIPANVVLSFFKRRRLEGVLFWSLFGFADFIIVQKK